MANTNPFDTGTGSMVDTADAQLIRRKFEHKRPVLADPEDDSFEPDMDFTGAFDDHDPDAQVRLLLDSDRMTATAMVRAPKEGGKPLAPDMIGEALKRAAVAYGLDQAALGILMAPTYDEKIVIAKGTPAQDGKDGSCEEHFPRATYPVPVENPTDPVDYQAIGVYRDLKAGTVVCTLTPPTGGAEGRNVRGAPLHPRPGRPAQAPAGEGMRELPDGRVVMAVPGNLVFKAGKFVVETTLQLSDTFYGVGNIVFSGDVAVEGGLPDGFSISAGGNVVLKGAVGAVEVHAKGDIEAAQQFNGGGKTRLEAGGQLTVGRVENAALRAGEKLNAAALVNCTAECEGEVDITNGAGLFCGGALTAFGNVKVRQLGGGNGKTALVIGVTTNQLEEQKRLATQLADVNKHLADVAQNVGEVERLIAAGRPIPPEKVQLLKRAQLQLPLSENKKKQIEQAIAELDKKLAGAQKATLTAGRVDPPVKISIGGRSTNLVEEYGACKVYLDAAGELVVAKQ